MILIRSLSFGASDAGAPDTVPLFRFLTVARYLRGFAHQECTSVQSKLQPVRDEND